MCESRKYSDVKLGDKTIDHISKGRRQADLMKFLQDEHKRYRTEIEPLYPKKDYDVDFEAFDVAKNEFLESLWDVISQHFDNINKG